MAKKQPSLSDHVAGRYKSSEKFTFTEKGNRKQNRVVRSFKKGARRA